MTGWQVVGITIESREQRTRYPIASSTTTNHLLNNIKTYTLADFSTWCQLQVPRSHHPNFILTASQRTMAAAAALAAAPYNTSILFTLPLELREMIYDFVFGNRIILFPRPDDARPKHMHPRLLRTCKTIRTEALPRFYKCTTLRAQSWWLRGFDQAVQWLMHKDEETRKLICHVEYQIPAHYEGDDEETRVETEKWVLRLCIEELGVEGVVLKDGALRVKAWKGNARPKKLVLD
ncbi:hypothetical protein LTR56_009499 [Elasticomyces elasticus]|nr:hypothetical protein LTR22_021485 [Elasticomyces elasticus]KAK3644834.1 hypothetical protein LTR56_009499 [Elasticomyces elasticus]KAK4930982.1 hypothetical protein LTR49_002397 [Elasticomyces elasticus]KAK5742543.1 hypothetical protein LTS12_024216 [Elasticomyces elasticus]